jgi:hypothetical protein
VIYLLDTSGLIRLLGDPGLQEAWYDAVDAVVAAAVPGELTRLGDQAELAGAGDGFGAVGGA